MAHLNVMSPPLIITHEEVDFTVETLGRAIRQVTDGLIRDGQKVA
jgi:adenosylmethionine-8-amino-7-oxononanoate aminotransferase